MKSKIKAEIKERRYRLPIKLLVNFEGGPLKGNYFIENLSSGGLFVAIEKPLVVGTKIKIQFILPHNRAEYTFEARVSWIREKSKETLLSGMGISFENLPHEQKELILKAIDQYKELIDG